MQVDELHKPRLRPRAESASEAVSELRAMLDRHLASIDSLDQKATFVIPALGAVGVLATPTRLAGLPGAAICLLSVAFSAALVAFMLAWRVLSARKFGFGPDPLKVALDTSAPREAFSQGLANSLAECVLHARDAIEDKARLLNLALFATTISVFCFLTAKIVEG